MYLICLWHIFWKLIDSFLFLKHFPSVKGIYSLRLQPKIHSKQSWLHKNVLHPSGFFSLSEVFLFFYLFIYFQIDEYNMNFITKYRDFTMTQMPKRGECGKKWIRNPEHATAIKSTQLDKCACLLQVLKGLCFWGTHFMLTISLCCHGFTGRTLYKVRVPPAQSFMCLST